jgi:hypothetical protein
MKKSAPFVLLLLSALATFAQSKEELSPLLGSDPRNAAQHARQEIAGCQEHRNRYENERTKAPSNDRCREEPPRDVAVHYSPTPENDDEEHVSALVDNSTNAIVRHGIKMVEEIHHRSDVEPSF